MIDYRKENFWCVYIHISPSNKYYVGVTKQNPPLKRWANGLGYRDNKYFSRAIEKYGWNNFQHIVIASNLTKKEAYDFEYILIQKLKSNHYKYGYNIAAGGEFNSGYESKLKGTPLSEETKNKIRRTKSENPYFHTEEWKMEQSNRTKQMWENPIYREIFSNTCTGRCGDKHPMYGKHGAEISTSKETICLNTMTVYESATAAASYTNGNSSKISMCCRGERKTSGKDDFGNKLRWQYLNDYLKENQITYDEARKSLFFILGKGG